MAKTDIDKQHYSSPPMEHHPLEPFLPKQAKVLFLGSFPPQKHRWSMDFFYPNFQNDMWRIMGLIFFGNKEYFILKDDRQFDRARIIHFCTEKGIALFDAAQSVRRLNDNASDKYLEIVEPTNLTNLLETIPECRTIVSTGQKATDVIIRTLSCQQPAIGAASTALFEGKEIRFFRMPSSSRAYPLSIERKAEAYRFLFQELDLH